MRRALLAMAATGLLAILVWCGVSVAETLLMVAVASLVGASIAWRLHKACD